jgi:hypothetical protein
MATYYVDFANYTPDTWTLGVYQTLPSSPGLDSVSWLQTTNPQQGTSTVTWQITYDVALANYVQTGGIGVYNSAQILPSSLGTAWKIIMDGNAQQLELDTDATAPPADQINISNQSGHLANPGIGMYGNPSVYQNEIYGGSTAEFIVKPVYWAALFNSLIEGEVISSNVSVGPQQLQFVSGQNLATVTASIVGENINLDVTYGNRASVDMTQVRQRLNSLDMRRKQLTTRMASR